LICVSTLLYLFITLMLELSLFLLTSPVCLLAFHLLSSCSISSSLSEVFHSGHNPQPTARNPQPTTYSPQPTTHNPQPATHSPQPATHNLQPTTHSPQPTTHSPQPFMFFCYKLLCLIFVLSVCLIHMPQCITLWWARFWAPLMPMESSICKSV
jgi:hypothetical protein